MKKIMAMSFLLLALGLTSCGRCEKEPIVQENQKLIVPPNFGNMPR
jgi:hypothetical protein